jgi:hypothetical protein
LSVKSLKEMLIFFIYLYLSRNADKTEDSLVQSESRGPQQASPDMVIEANYHVHIFSRNVLIRKNLKSIQRFTVVYKEKKNM